MLDKIWRFLKTSSQNSDPSLPAIEVPPTVTDVEKDEGDEEVDREAKVWFDRGNEQYEQGNFQEALVSYDRSIEFKYNAPEVWEKRGLALQKLGDYQGAIDSNNTASTLYRYSANPDTASVSQSQENFFSRSDIKSFFNQALEIRLYDYKAWYTRGIALGKLGRWQVVYEILQGQFPKSPPVTRTLLTHNLTQRGYEGRVLTLETGLEYCLQNTHPEGYGKLHRALERQSSKRG